MLAILNSLSAHNFPIFQSILMILVSKFMVHRGLSDKTFFLLGLLSPLNYRNVNSEIFMRIWAQNLYFVLNILDFKHLFERSYLGYYNRCQNNVMLKNLT